jgi:hypothetical protein
MVSATAASETEKTVDLDADRVTWNKGNILPRSV